MRSYGEVYNDLDGEIVNVFRVARDHGEELRRVLALTPFSRREFMNALYLERADEPVERARRLVVRSFMGHGSNGHSRSTGFRASSNRYGTTPAHDWRNYPEAFRAIIARLQGVCIEERPAAQVMLAHDGPKTLHYVDPPYLMETRADTGKDYAHELSEQDHVDLAATLHALVGSVVVSGYPSPLYETLYAGWRRIERPALADGARPRIEVLWIRQAR